jgi:hypothetical protein
MSGHAFDLNLKYSSKSLRHLAKPALNPSTGVDRLVRLLYFISQQRRGLSIGTHNIGVISSYGSRICLPSSVRWSVSRHPLPIVLPAIQQSFPLAGFNLYGINSFKLEY